MKRMIKFGGIEQFRSIVKDVKHNTQFIGMNYDGSMNMDRDAKMPVIVATLSEKIHGFNKSFCYNNIDGWWCQSANQIIKTSKEQYGILDVFTEQLTIWKGMVYALAEYNKIDLDKFTITIYSERAGNKIMKKSACTGLSQRSIIFQHAKVTPIENTNDVPPYWIETKYNDIWLSAKQDLIFNIMNYKTYQIPIDFNNVVEAKEKLQDIVENEIEPNSPFGQAMGIENNIGEGVVATFNYKGKLYRFKVKGNLHNVTASPKLPLTPEQLEEEQVKIEFANYSCTPSRLEQSWQKVFGLNNELEPDIKKMGNFLKELNTDIIKEESDVLEDKKLVFKDVSSKISQIARVWFKEEIDKFYGII